MARVNVDTLGGVGLVRDVFPSEMPPEAWTNVRNVRMGPYGAEVFLGHSKILGTDVAGWTNSPLFLMYVPKPGGSGFWLSGSTGAVAVRTAITPYTETDITRAAGAYSATADKKWQGDLFAGLAILNNGIDEPQAWTAIAAATKLVNLSAVAGVSSWNNTHRCRVIRPFGRFLVAADITKGGTRYPQLVKWSHPADPGAFPVSWDETNPAYDAGEYPLNDSESPIVDMRTLRNVNMIYTTDQVYTMSLVQGGDVFGFRREFAEQGALATGCVASFKNKGAEYHCVLGGDDLFIHNGQSANSIITPSMRRWLFSQIDPTNFQRSFVVANPAYSEMWICFPQIGMEQPTLALVWNWESNSIGFRDLLQATSGADTRTGASTKGTPWIASGFIEDTAAEAWSSDATAWSADASVWDQRSVSPVMRHILMADRSAGKRTFLLDSTYAFDGEYIPVELERESLSLLRPDGKPIVGQEQEVLVTEVWPRADMEAYAGTDPNNVWNIQVGFQEDPADAVAWGDTVKWYPGASQLSFVPYYGSGRILSIKFSGTFNVRSRLTGYGLEVEGIGRYN